MKVAKADWRALVLGTPASQAPIRSSFMATAVRRCPRCVFARPMYRVRRSRHTRTPWEIVPSMPARCPYRAAQVGLRSRCRAARRAGYWASGRSVRLRRGNWRFACGLMHCTRLGQAVQSVSANLILITAFLRLSTAGVPLLLERELPSFSAEDKRKDPRYPWFARRYGHRCWELDALNPNILRTRLEQIIYQVIDHDAWERCKRAQEAERASLTTILNTWKGYTA
jgi:hypothetical protein